MIKKRMVGVSTKIHAVKIQGISMFPTLRTDQVVYYKKCLVKNLKAGNVILFKINTKTICHRLVFKHYIGDKLVLLEKGDNPLFVISKIYPRQILGEIINPPKRSWGLIIITIPGLFLGYILFMIKKIFFRNKKTGIIKQLTRLTKRV